MATKAESQATAYRAEASSERTEGVTERRPPEPGGGGNVTGGLRTERITLEITHDVAGYPLADWNWRRILRCAAYNQSVCESVRVVEDRSQRRQRLADAADRAAKALSDFDAKETS